MGGAETKSHSLAVLNYTLANFVGIVVGFLSVCTIRLRSLLLAEYDTLKAKGYHKLFTGPLAFSAPQPVGVSHRRDPRLSPGRPPEK